MILTISLFKFSIPLSNLKLLVTLFSHIVNSWGLVTFLSRRQLIISSLSELSIRSFSLLLSKLNNGTTFF